MRLINGTAADSIPAADRGLAYGDGVFRTLRAANGEPLHWRRQFNKLADDCARLSIPCAPATVLLAEVRAVARQYPQAVVKITVTRGSGPRGYAPPRPCTPLRIVEGAPFSAATDAMAGIAVHVCAVRLAHQPALAGVKHLNRLENVLARAEWSDPAIREGLMRDQQDNVIGGTMSNVFIAEQGRLVTPPLHQCGVAGVTRARVMALAASAAIPCSEAYPTLQRVLDADEVFLVNSLIGLWPLAHMGTRRWNPGPLAREIGHALTTEDARAS